MSNLRLLLRVTVKADPYENIFGLRNIFKLSRFLQRST